MYKCFRPGKVWYDTNGKRIQAHGGSIIYTQGKYWFYGENKEGITGRATGEKCPYWHHGVKLYSSTDLYNWVDEGFAVRESDDINNPFHPKNIVERPHIIYNEKTKKYVLWAKYCSGLVFSKLTFAVCVGDDIKDMQYVGTVDFSKYDNIYAGDFDFFKKDGKAYIVYAHDCMIVQELTEDYTELSSTYSKHLAYGRPPFLRESPAYFEINGRSYLLTSGQTGYYPNPTICYDITDLHGEWIDLGLTCVNDKNNDSFRSQFSSVFKHPKTNKYVALGDRWITDMIEDAPDMHQVILGMFNEGQGIKLPAGEFEKFSDENTSEANYVWLPLTLNEQGKPEIHWKREWTLEDNK